MTKKIGLILLNLAVLAIGIGYPYLETRLSGQIAATFNSRLLGIATAVKAAFYVLLLAEGLLAMHLTLGLRRGAGARFVPIVKAVRLLAAAAAAALFVFAVYPPQTASLALLAAMQTVDLLLLALPGMLRKKEQ
ncbi:MAG: hypothetical protein EGQ82_04410 [Clostridiales bacterium]|nr:hypothetical protein [Clostridiales bacterium]